MLNLEYVAYVATLVKQKEVVDELEELKRVALRELEGLRWSDRVLEEQGRQYAMNGTAAATS